MCASVTLCDTSVDVQLKTNAGFIEKWFPLELVPDLGLVFIFFSVCFYLCALSPSFMCSFSLAFSTKETLSSIDLAENMRLHR